MEEEDQNDSGISTSEITTTSSSENIPEVKIQMPTDNSSSSTVSMPPISPRVGSGLEKSNPARKKQSSCCCYII